MSESTVSPSQGLRIWPLNFELLTALVIYDAVCDTDKYTVLYLQQIHARVSTVVDFKDFFNLVL
jgi:hypothetical protein